jgi:maltose O-acetyltransferase
MDVRAWRPPPVHRLDQDLVAESRNSRHAFIVPASRIPPVMQPQPTRERRDAPSQSRLSVVPPLHAPSEWRGERGSRIALLFRDLWINGVAAWPIWPGMIRQRLYRLYGMDVRTGGVSPGCFFGSPRVGIGEGTTVNYDCFFDSLAEIEIGRDCAIGMQVLFCTSGHELGPASRRAGRPKSAPIRVGDGCWVGARAIVLAGVTIGEGCVVAAGAVVSKSCEPNGLYAGVPAQRVKDLPEGRVERALATPRGG